MKSLVLHVVYVATILVLAVLLYTQQRSQPANTYNPVWLPQAASIDTTYLPRYEIRTFDLPDTMYFAGERVPLEYADIRERLDREIHTNIYWNTNTVFLMKRAARWLPQIEPILVANGIPADFKYLPLIEAGLTNAVSHRQAVGFWQILKGTGKELGLEVRSEVDERYHPLKSTVAATKYLKKAYEKLGSWTNVAAAYNMGVSGLNRRLNQQQVSSYYDLLLNQETTRYVFRILAIKELMENPERYGYYIPDYHLYSQQPVQVVEVSNTIANLTTYAKDNGINYKLLKLYNPWLRKNKLTVKRGKTYQITLVQQKPAAPTTQVADTTLQPQPDTLPYVIDSIH